MSQVTTKYYIFDIPVDKKHNQLTVAELNTNLEFLANKLCYALGMVIFSELTEEDPTYGKAFYIGFENAAHATLCIFSPWRSFSANSHIYCIEFVDEDNNPISENVNKYQRNGTSQAGWQLDTADGSSWCMLVVENDNYYYLGYFSATGKTLESEVVYQAYRDYTWQIGSYDQRRCPWMLINKNPTKDWYGHWNEDAFHFINTPINRKYYNYVGFNPRDFILNNYIKRFFDINKKYIIDHDMSFYNENVDSILENPWTPGSDFRSLAIYNVQTNFRPYHGEVTKINDDYYLLLIKYGGSSDPNRPPFALKMGDSYDVQVIDLR